MPSASFKKSGTRRCVTCNSFVSGSASLCLSCASIGEGSMKLIIAPEYGDMIGRIIHYHCDKCGGNVAYLQSDPGILPFIIQCKARGDNRMGWPVCDGGMYRVGYWTKGDKDAMTPTREFFRPKGLDLSRMDQGTRALVERGMLDERSLAENMVKSSYERIILAR